MFIMIWSYYFDFFTRIFIIIMYIILFLGFFKVMVDKILYLLIEEIIRIVNIGFSRLGYFCFYYLKDIKLENFIIK